MSLESLLGLFIFLRLGQHLIETALSWLNYRFAHNPDRLKEASRVLGISAPEMQKAQAYAKDKFWFGQISGWVSLAATLLFLGFGGLGWIERTVSGWTGGPEQHPIWTGLGFFALLGVLNYLLGVGFSYYFTFVIEQKHGFNRQTLGGFVSDQFKTLALSVVIGGALLSLLLSIMGSMGDSWWWVAWLLLFAFNLITAWIYPSVLAPLFNKFSPLEEGELKDSIFQLARKIEFQADGISIMDASKRSSHGNAYFTGVFGKKRIVLFDTLVKSMQKPEIVAVLAHELGHFKLNHVRWSLIRNFFMMGLIFFVLSLCLPLAAFYQAFGLSGVSNYGALTVFSLWFGPISFLLQPIGSLISRRNEFAADAFALEHVEDRRSLGNALLKLRENSHVVPISHPWYSAIYHSHPPLLERLKAMGYLG